MGVVAFSKILDAFGDTPKASNRVFEDALACTLDLNWIPPTLPVFPHRTLDMAGAAQRF